MNTRTMHNIAISLILGGTLSVVSNSVLAAVSQNPVDISQTPLSVGASGVAPNIMLMVDNSGSMDSSFTTPATATLSNMPSSFTYNCPSPITTGSTSSTGTGSNAPPVVYMTVSSSSAKFCTATAATTGRFGNTAATICGGTAVSFGNSSSAKCFNPSQYYKVTYSSSSSSVGASLGTYLGANLNWYFSSNSFSSGSLTAGSTSWTRLSMAKAAANNLVTSLTPATGESIKVRMGLASYNQDTSLGGSLLVPISDLNSTQATNLTTAVNALSASSPTPLSTTLSDIGRYFTTGYTGTTLKLHPSATASDVNLNTLFNNQSIDTSKNTSGLSATASPIQNYCQKNAVILVSDGLPNYDRNVSTLMADYTGDCGTKKVCDSTIDTSYTIGFPGPTTATTYTNTPTRADTGPNSCGTYNACATRDNRNRCQDGYVAPWTVICKNGSKTGRAYEAGGSDFLDDVAATLYDIDLRPDLRAAHPSTPKQNLSTYTIGIADPSVKAQVRPSNGGTGIETVGTVLEDAATRGGGTFTFADNYQQLADALDKMVSAIRKGVGSFSTITANSTQLTANTALFQASYDTADWTGDLYALKLDSSTGNVIYPAAWNAGTKIVTPVPAAQTEWQNRNLFTYNTTAKGITFKGATSSVICAKLTSTQLSALGIASCSNASDIGLWRLDYLRGDISHEVVNSSQPQYTTDPRLTNNTAANRMFRNRVRFRQNNSGIGETPAYKQGDVWQDPWLLGDIVNSGATYVGTQDYAYANKSITESSSYATFVASKSTWKPMLYIGANDGFLHGVDASLTTTGGSEVFSYMPNSIFKSGGGLINLSSPTYSHQYFVDGTARVSDVYFDNAWHTVLVGTTGAGGSGIFALDVTDPTGASSGVAGSAANGTVFGASDVLWEINNTNTPIAADATNLAGNLGYALPQATMGRMNDGSWAAIVANGYVSTNNKAVLYIVNIKTGAIIATLDTLTGSATAANGLSTPVAADIDGNGTVDAIYAGDLLGNMWKFDVSDSNNTKWQIAYGSKTVPAPLFTACSDGTSTTTCDASRQPITNKPQLASVSAVQSTGGIMVYFGTGQYFQDSDNNITNTKTQTFYGIWDKCPPISTLTGTNSTISTSPASVCSTSVPSPARTTPANTPAGALVQQTIIAQQSISDTNFRGTSNNTIDWSTQKGWYMDFVNPNTNKNEGERIVSASLWRDGRIIFATLIPIPTTTSSTDVCIAGSTSTSWFMVLDAATGSRPSTPTLGDTMITVGTQSVPVSGQQTKDGSIGTPTIITGAGSGATTGSGTTGSGTTGGGTTTGGNIDVSPTAQGYSGNSNGGTTQIGIHTDPASTSGAGRQSWRQL